MPSPASPWYLAEGIAFFVATRDAQGNPNVTRGVAARHTPDGGTLIVYLSVPEGLTALSNLSDNGHIAFLACRSLDYQTLQLKGTDARLVSAPDDEAFARRYLAANKRAIIEQLGVPAPVVERFWSHEAVAVAFTPESAWDQTPGANAGREIPL